MQYDAKTPAEYMKMLEDDWRKEKLQGLRALVKSEAPELKEGITYKMLSYSDRQGPVFQLNAQKNSVNLYVGDAKKVDPDGSLLAGLDCGKGCIRFKKSSAIGDTRIGEFIQRVARIRRNGGDVDC